MNALLEFVFTLLGLGILLGGGELMVRGAGALARRLGVSTTIIGLTVVAFGTSTPELAVNIAAALRAGEVSFGNIIGSNLANIGLGIGLAALMAPLTVESVVLRRELPMMLLATLAAVVAAFDPYLSGGPAFYSRSEGILLLLFFAIFIYYNLVGIIQNRLNGPALQAVSESLPQRPLSIPVALGLFIAGVAGLVLGAEVTVRFAVSLAITLGFPKAFIGFTLIALGTSLPEIAISVAAVRRGETELLIGNIVGSNIFNLLFILGVTSTIRPVPVPEQGFSDLLITLILSLGLWFFSLAGKIRREKGLFFLLVYLIYLGWKSSTLAY